MAQNTARKTDANRRDKPRLRSFMAATVLYNNGQSTLDCVIRNISEDGAKLALPAEVALPDRFDLAVPQRNKTYRATMARRRGRRQPGGCLRRYAGGRRAGRRSAAAHPHA
jgi:hypothetical protein